MESSSNIIQDLQQNFINISQNNNSTNNEETATDGPDSDTIKMFVGQIPKSWDENKLIEFFTQYGPVFQLNILRDKGSEESKGCCFVTFYHRKDAINAQNALHNVHTMPGLSHPVQMKPADTENRNDRKLFIGMLSKSMDESDVRKIFKEFGQIEECNILRDQGKSKGCAFLTFVSRSCALQAVRKMNQSQIFEGCNKPIVVKFVDGGKEKNVGTKRLDVNRGEPNNNFGAMTQLQNTVGQKPGIEILTNLASILQQPGIAELLNSAISPQLPQREINGAINYGGFEKPAITPGCIFPNVNQKSDTQLATLHQNQRILTPFQQQPATKFCIPPSFLAQNHQNLLAQICSLQMTGFFTNPITTPNFQQTQIREIQPNAAMSPSEKNSRGPEGCNLFIYHLPQEFSDSDLVSLFCNYGPILSAKVFVDKQTNLSKCFGFVSFNNANSAQNAITGMNGFQIGNKRLKVQLKRSDMKPYEKP
uniref:RRM domain-containing protein n=1 Tax=Meloidogyne incognita TaxID=6306 RepID=A0A914N6T1_MELIC